MLTSSSEEEDKESVGEEEAKWDIEVSSIFIGNNDQFLGLCGLSYFLAVSDKLVRISDTSWVADLTSKSLLEVFDLSDLESNCLFWSNELLVFLVIVEELLLLSSISKVE